jgi:fatty-acid desaturase
MKELVSPSQKTPKSGLRGYGISWVILSPVIFLMAAISTVKSSLTYNIQLVLFSAVALTGLVAGVGALYKRLWAARTLLVLSWLGAAYFLGSATLLLVWPFIP